MSSLWQLQHRHPVTSAAVTAAPTVAGIEAAWADTPAAFRDTPQYRSDTLDDALGARVTVKVECVNPIRSFKARGACWFAARRGSEAARRGTEATRREPEATRPEGPRRWVTGSAGNFGQGLAWAARRHGIPLTVFSALRANPDKVAAMRRLGAEVELAGSDFDAAKAVAQEFARDRDALFVEDGREPEIAEGAGGIAVELTRGFGGDCVLVPVGNGALIGGMGSWIRARAPGIGIIGVVAEGAPVMRRAFVSGDAAPAVDPPRTAADGIAVRVPVPEAVSVMRDVADDVIEVGEDALTEAVSLLHRVLGLVVEPAGAAGVAALLQHRARFAGIALATPLCGGNIAPGNAPWRI